MDIWSVYPSFGSPDHVSVEVDGSHHALHLFVNPPEETVPMDIQHGDRAVVRDIRFENIRVEVDDVNPRPRMQQTRDEMYEADPNDDYRPHLELDFQPKNG